MLSYDPAKRPTAAEVLVYFQENSEVMKREDQLRERESFSLHWCSAHMGGKVLRHSFMVKASDSSLRHQAE